MHYRMLLYSLIVALTVVGCDEAGSSRVEQAGEALGRAGESLTRAGQKAKEVAADVVLPPRREEQLGDRLARQIAADSQLVTGEPVVGYVQQLGRSIVEAADDKPQGIDFDFHVIRDPAINAFAIPGGHIYVTTGLLAAAETEAELVSVLAHEVAHVTERHIAERMTAGYGVATLTSLALGEEAGLLEQIGAELLAQGFLLKHSRDNEREADSTGLSYLVDAGYSPTGYVAFFETLAKQPSPPAILSTHPNPGERADTARQALTELPAEVVERPVNRERYQQMTRAL